MGVDRLLKNNKPNLLIISTFLLIMTSYYYSVCGLIVIGIYYLFEYLNKQDISCWLDIFPNTKA